MMLSASYHPVCGHFGTHALSNGMAARNSVCADPQGTGPMGVLSVPGLGRFGADPTTLSACQHHHKLS